MCYAIPGLLEKIDGNFGTIDYFGEKRKVIIDETENHQVGEYVYAQGGVVIRKVNRDEALEVLKFWKDKFFELKEIDKSISKISEKDKENIPSNTLQILQKINLNQTLEKGELLHLLNIEQPNELKLLYETANNQRQKELDNACCVHGIIEFSNYCNENCHYCGIRKDKDIQRYRLTEDEIYKTAEHAVNDYGFKALVLQSGEDPWYTDEKLINIVTRLKQLGILIFLSIGMRSKELYNNLYKAGAKAALLRFETSNREIFQKLRPNSNFDQRIDLIKHLIDTGYVVATGFIVGLPGETNEDIINNILLTKSLKPDMYSLGPLIPTKNTPLEYQKLPTKDIILKTIALTRFIDKQAKILATTALETLNKEAKREGLLAGANSLMINLTPKNLRKLYSIYDNKAGNDKDIKESIDETVELLFSIGRAPTDLGI